MGNDAEDEMARSRSLKPGFFKNDELCALGQTAMLAYAGLWTLADREGRLEDRPKRIKAEVFPYFNINMEKVLDQLAEGGFIVRYRVDEECYIAIPTWNKHQNPHIKEAASTIPAPCSNGSCAGNSGASPADSGLLTPDSGLLTVVSGCGVPAATPPLTPAEFSAPHPDELARKLVSELMPLHWFASNAPAAERALALILANAVNPSAVMDSIRANHATWAAWHRANPRAKRKALQWWIADGDYMHPAPKTGVLATSEEGW